MRKVAQCTVVLVSELAFLSGPNDVVLAAEKYVAQCRDSVMTVRAVHCQTFSR